MPGAEPQVWRLAALVPVAAAAAVYAWAHWCYGGASAPSGTVALAGGAVLVIGGSVAYFALVRGSGSLFGALFLALGLLLTVTAADQAASRGRSPCASYVTSRPGCRAPPERALPRRRPCTAMC